MNKPQWARNWGDVVVEYWCVFISVFAIGMVSGIIPVIVLVAMEIF